MERSLADGRMVLKTKRMGDKILVKLRNPALGTLEWTEMDFVEYMENVRFGSLAITKGTAMSMEVTQIRRQIEKNENAILRLNCTPEQLFYEKEGFPGYKSMLSPGRFSDANRIMRGETPAEIPYKVMALMVLANPESGSYVPITEGNAIQPEKNCRAVFFHRIPAENWEGHPQRKKWRLNLEMKRLRVVNDDDQTHEMLVTNEGEPSSILADLWQMDAAKMSVQDHPKYDVKHFNPLGLMGPIQDPHLYSPIAGKFSITYDDLHVQMFVGNVPVLRVMLADGAMLETHANDDTLPKDGTHVQRGQPLVRMAAPMHFGMVKWQKGKNRRPAMDEIRGSDVLAATTEPHLVTIAAEMMRRCSLMHKGEYTELTAPMEQWAPRHLVELPVKALALMAAVDDWEFTPELREAMMVGLRPKGTFRVLAELETPAKFVNFAEHARYNELLFEDGQMVVLPKAAELLAHLVPGVVVAPQDPVACWTAPRLFGAWADVVEALGGDLPYIVREFFSQNSVRPGTNGFNGYGVLVPREFLPNSAFAAGGAFETHGPLAHHVDLRPGLPFLHETGVIVGCPIKQENWADFFHHVNQIGYDWTPGGPHLSQHAIVADQSHERTRQTSRTRK